ncbi:MAG: hypothetical protein GKR87_00295 [Kiritimatiellae bacterium]|nr:hypothetical protein [Kiritimatiellia bacterium]
MSDMLPGHQEQPQEITCHSCGQFVGPLNVCPHCGAKITKRLSVRFFRFAALVLALTGLVFLWLMATRGEIPVIKIGEIERTMNFAFIRVAGQVIGDARIYREAGRVASLSFTVDDGTGAISVKAYRGKARELLELDHVPRAGDEVDVAGSLNVAADRTSLWLGAPDQIKIIRDQARELSWNQVHGELEGKNVIIEGVILEVTNPKLGTRAPWVIKFTDGTGEGRISAFADIYEEILEKVHVKPGTVFQVRTTVVNYQEKLQLQLNQANDLTLLPITPAAFFKDHISFKDDLRVGNITTDLEGQLIRARGRIAKRTEPDPASKAQHRMVLQQGEDTVEIVYKSSAAKELPENILELGTEIHVQGHVKSLKNGLRLNVYHASQIQRIEVT